MLAWTRQDQFAARLKAFTLQVWAQEQLRAERPFVGSKQTHTFELAAGALRPPLLLGGVQAGLAEP